ncbi:DUF5597 domain-containing protein [Sphingomonas sp. 2SG]|uniref:GH35 family beta-galactosidase n=1 Tax=Sphingomonas sp. 2SG TaxID=2502201 RepID=UPI001BB20CD8|nr:DUF5597 domain-containing protein [Sphingomonas sp. 2SG]
MIAVIAASGLRLTVAAALAASTPATAAAQDAMPQVRHEGAATQLIVDGEPWTALAGEVHNSTASSAAYMAPVWDRLEALSLNTVVTPVYWELLEPVQGKYDFTRVDSQLAEARKHNLRLVLLWFGSFKNAKSTYAPAWLRADHDRYARVVTRPSPLPFAKGEAPLSVFDPDTAAADSHAFAELMQHLAKVDPQHTVIAVQVENETGVLGDSRDRSPDAEAAWRAPVPAALMQHLQRNRGKLAPSLEALWAQRGHRRAGSWAEVFGETWEAEELFMAWGVSRFVGQVAAAGKAKLALPMYANAWIGPQKLDEPAGAYPSGGPVPRVIDVWRAGAPALDWLSPDIYVDDFAGWAKAYARPGNLLFVPEARFIVGNLFLAIGRYGAVGFSPFGIEDGIPGNQMSQAYRLLGGLGPMIGEAQASGAISGFALVPGETFAAHLGGYDIKIAGQRETVSKMLLDMGISIPTERPERKPQNIGDNASEPPDVRPMGMIMQLAKNEFLIVGKDLSVSFVANGRNAELERVEEGHYDNGRWISGRVLNGDERLRIVPSDDLGMVRVTLLNASH